MENNSLITREMETFKVRMFTNIPPNAVLVGNSVITKNARIYTKALFHLPWFQSRFITLETQEQDLKKETYEVGTGGLELVADLAVGYKVLPMMNDDGKKYTVKDRWKAFTNRFKNKTFSQIVKVAIVAAATTLLAIHVGPFAFVLPAISAGYISFGYQDPEYIKKQNAYKAAYNTTTAIKELEQIVYDKLRTYYASHEYEEIRGKGIDLHNTEFADLKLELDRFGKDRGITITRISIKSADLTEESNKILQESRKAEIEAARIRTQGAAEADAIRQINDALADRIAKLTKHGMSSKDIAQILAYGEVGKGNSTIILNSGNMGNASTFAAGMHSAPQSKDNEDTENIKK